MKLLTGTIKACNIIQVADDNGREKNESFHPAKPQKKEVDKLLPAIYTIKADSSSQHGVL